MPTSKLTSREIYDEYINSAAWTNKKNLMAKEYELRSWEISCFKCGRLNDLQVHHNYYIKHKYLGHENLSDLDYLCTNCHSAWHTIQKASGLSQNQSLERYYAFITNHAASSRTKEIHRIIKEKILIDEREIVTYFLHPEAAKYKKTSQVCGILFMISIPLIFFYGIGILIMIAVAFAFFTTTAPNDYDLFSQREALLNSKKQLLSN